MDYINITCAGDHTLTFSGSTAIGLLPPTSDSGEYAFWSNKGDESDMTLTREFDFTSVSGPSRSVYWTWYDIEEDWDYLYLEASTDGRELGDPHDALRHRLQTLRQLVRLGLHRQTTVGSGDS